MKTLTLPLENAMRPAPASGHAQRNPMHAWLISAAVVLIHIALLWAMERGWPDQPSPIEPAQVMMVSVLAQSPEPPTPPAPRTAYAPKTQPLRKPAPARAVPSMPEDTSPVASVTAPAPALAPVPAAAPMNAVASAIAGSTPTGSNASLASGSAVIPATPASLVLPSSDADYLNNPAPAYPRMSKRLGEQGTVIVRVFIGLLGSAEKAEIRQSSGYDRLDAAALETVQRWRYVPGKRHGNPEAMWFNVPVRFVLE